MTWYPNHGISLYIGFEGRYMVLNFLRYSVWLVEVLDADWYTERVTKYDEIGYFVWFYNIKCMVYRESFGREDCARVKKL